MKNVILYVDDKKNKYFHFFLVVFISLFGPLTFFIKLDYRVTGVSFFVSNKGA